MWLYLSSPNGQRVIDCMNRLEQFCNESENRVPRGILGALAFSEHAGNIVATVQFRDRSPGGDYIVKALKAEFPDVFPDAATGDGPAGDGWVQGWRDFPGTLRQSYDWRIKVTASGCGWTQLAKLELGGNHIFVYRDALLRALER